MAMLMLRALLRMRGRLGRNDAAFRLSCSCVRVCGLALVFGGLRFGCMRYHFDVALKGGVVSY